MWFGAAVVAAAALYNFSVTKPAASRVQIVGMIRQALLLIPAAAAILSLHEHAQLCLLQACTATQQWHVSTICYFDQPLLVFD